MRALANGLLTGLTLQLAVGPVFFYLANLALQQSVFAGFAGVLAVTLVDFIYISLAIFGIGQLLEHQKFKKLFGIVSSAVLIFFGVVILNSVRPGNLSGSLPAEAVSLFSSFSSVFLLTLSSPMTIVFFTGLFTAKAVEYCYTRKELWLFGIGTGLATLLFMGSSVVVFSLAKGTIPPPLIRILNGIVGCLLIAYGGLRLGKSVRNN